MAALAISRIKPEVPDAGKPSGPLIRYLSTLYSRLHTRLEAHGFTRHLAAERLWSPTHETLLAWVANYRSSATKSAG